MSTHEAKLDVLNISPLKQALIEARALISKPEAWCQHALAHRADGKPTHHLDIDAISFCAVGALGKVTVAAYRTIHPDNRAAFNDALTLLNKITTEEHCKSLPGYNNSHSHAEVLALFDKAIALV